MEEISKLKEIAAKQASKITNADKEFIGALAARYGVEMPTNTRCKSCYIDAAVLVYNAIIESTKKENKEAAFVLKKNVDVYWRGIRINAATITDEKAKKWIEDGFPVIYFEKWK